MSKQNQSPQEKTIKYGSLDLSEGQKTLNIVEKGTSGTDFSGHRFFEEYLTKLLGTEGIDEYDEMRRSDDQVAMLLRVVKNPIMSASWFIDPVDESPEEKEIADFVSYILFENMGTEENPKTFEKFKRESLTSVEFGYALFEITNKIVFDDEIFGSYVGIKGLDWRSPKTIEEWYIARSGRLEQVRQIDNSEHGGDFFIPGKFILHIAAEMEGDNYEGISMLRPIYGNFLRKDVLRKLQMIGIERAATGVPVGEIPIGQENSPAQVALEDSLRRFVSHEEQYMTVSKGFTVNSIKIDHDAEKVQKAIEAENVGMTKSFLANFMELGLNSSGSFALGTDLSDIFLSGLEVYANAITSPFNIKLIPDLVKSNFGKRRKYPNLIIEGINDKAGKEFAEVLKSLKETDVIQITDRLKAVVHKKYKLPDFDPNLIATPAASAELITPEVKPTPLKLSEIEYNLAEKNLSKNIEMVGKEMTDLMKAGLTPRAEKLTSNMMDVWRNADKSKRMEEVNRLIVPGKNEYKKIISEALAPVYVRATDGVKKELSSDGLKLAEPTEAEIRGLPPESKATAKSQQELLVESQDADLRKQLFFSFTAKADTLPTEAQMNANLLKVVDRYINGPSVRTAGPNAVANAVNLARNAVFQQKDTLESIESFIFMNPSPEAAICVELQNRVFTKEEYIITDKLPPLHHHCNSWIKAQVRGKTGNKSLSPAGLSIQGTDNQIETIEKSIKF